MVYLIFDAGSDKWFREFKNKNELYSFKQIFQMVTDGEKVNIVNNKNLLQNNKKIDDLMFENLVEICKREIKK